MAFRFNLENVLKHRQRQEDIAQREFAEAQAAVDECLKTIEAMYARLDEVRQEICDAQKLGGPAEIETVRSLESFIGGHKIRIEHKRLEARELMQIAEAKQEALIVAAQEKKILSKLKDKRRGEYQEWVRRMEVEELDDIAMIRQARGKR
ncbi:MAG TPA: flagellar export protein FliJ [Bdellovibrionales bacterium]|mgnify:CR=1 FL=1|nr:flagellar export protein FliJ [Bdellovibrionales bacterium]